MTPLFIKLFINDSFRKWTYRLFLVFIGVATLSCGKNALRKFLPNDLRIPIEDLQYKPQLHILFDETISNQNLINFSSSFNDDSQVVIDAIFSNVIDSLEKRIPDGIKVLSPFEIENNIFVAVSFKENNLLGITDSAEEFGTFPNVFLIWAGDDIDTMKVEIAGGVTSKKKGEVYLEPANLGIDDNLKKYHTKIIFDQEDDNARSNDIFGFFDCSAGDPSLTIKSIRTKIDRTFDVPSDDFKITVNSMVTFCTLFTDGELIFNEMRFKAEYIPSLDRLLVQLKFFQDGVLVNAAIVDPVFKTYLDKLILAGGMCVKLSDAQEDLGGCPLALTIPAADLPITVLADVTMPVAVQNVEVPESAE